MKIEDMRACPFEHSSLLLPEDWLEPFSRFPKEDLSAGRRAGARGTPRASFACVVGLHIEVLTALVV